MPETQIQAAAEAHKHTMTGWSRWRQVRAFVWICLLDALPFELSPHIFCRWNTRARVEPSAALHPEQPRLVPVRVLEENTKLPGVHQSPSLKEDLSKFLHESDLVCDAERVVIETSKATLSQQIFFAWQLATVFVGAAQLIWTPIGNGAVDLTDDPITQALRSYSFPPRFLHGAYMGCVCALVVFVTTGAIMSFIPTKTLLSVFGSTLCIYGRGLWYFAMIALSVPIISTLMSIFLCGHVRQVEGTSTPASPSLVHQIDPHIACWGSTHISLIAASMLSLLLFYYAFVVKRMEVYSRLERAKASTVSFFYEANPAYFFSMLITKTIFCITTTFIASSHKNAALWIYLTSILCCFYVVNKKISFTNVRAHGLQGALLFSAAVPQIVGLSGNKTSPLGLGTSIAVVFFLSYVLCVTRASWPVYLILVQRQRIAPAKDYSLNVSSPLSWVSSPLWVLSTILPRQIQRLLPSPISKSYTEQSMSTSLQKNNTSLPPCSSESKLQLTSSLGGAKKMFLRHWCPTFANPSLLNPKSSWLLSISHLDLQGNSLDTRDIRSLCLALLTHQMPLETLDLSRNLIGKHAARWLAALVYRHQTLHTLNLNENHLLHSDGLGVLVDSILSSPKSCLHRLLVDSCDLDSTAAHTVARVLSLGGSTSLLELSLRGNHISVEGAEVLARTIRVMERSPLLLRLEWNNLRREGISHILHAIHENPYAPDLFQRDTDTCEPANENQRQEKRIYNGLDETNPCLLLDVRLSMNGLSRREMADVTAEVKMRQLIDPSLPSRAAAAAAAAAATTITISSSSSHSIESIQSALFEEHDRMLEDKAKASLPLPYPGTIVDALGGESALVQIVDDFYYRLVTDPQLKPFFKDISMNRMRHLQYAFLSAGMSGSAPPKGTHLHRSHKHLGLTDDHMDATIGHLVASIHQHTPAFSASALLSLHMYLESLRSAIVSVGGAHMPSHAHRNAALFLRQYASQRNVSNNHELVSELESVSEVHSAASAALQDLDSGSDSGLGSDSDLVQVFVGQENIDMAKILVEGVTCESSVRVVKVSCVSGDDIC